MSVLIDKNTKVICQGFTGKNWGYAAALTVVTAIILAIVTMIYLRLTKKSDEVY